jgi:hypothetical protein
MYNQDPRIAYAQYLQSIYGIAPVQTPVYPFAQPYAQAPVQTAYSTPVMTNDTQSTYWMQCLNELRTQVATLTELVRTDLAKHAVTEMYAHTPVQHGLGFQSAPWQQRAHSAYAHLGALNGAGVHGIHGFNGINTGINGAQAWGLQAAAGIPGGLNGLGLHGIGGIEASPIRLRENDSHSFCEILLPNVTIGDVEVEVQGNRITCRTRVPVAPLTRWLQATQLPRGFELFELPDGRIEFCWVSTTPFIAKEVEASFKEGFLCICVPKTEVLPRHNVKVVKETASTRRASGEMNS